MDQMKALSGIQDNSSDIAFRSDIMRATAEIIDDDFVSTKIENFPLWMTGTKSLKLTFFTEEDARIMENLFEAEACKLKRSIPPCQHNSDFYTMLGQTRMLFFSNIRRSLGTQNRNQLNERVILQSQFKQIITSSGSEDKGILGKLFGR